MPRTFASRRNGLRGLACGEAGAVADVDKGAWPMALEGRGVAECGHFATHAGVPARQAAPLLKRNETVKPRQA